MSRGATTSRSTNTSRSAGSYDTQTTTSRSSGTFSERSTLTSFRGSTSSFRGNTTQPHEPLPGTYSTRSTYYPHSHSVGYHTTYYPSYYTGFSAGISFSTGSFYFGVGYSYPYYRSSYYYNSGYYHANYAWNPAVYYGSHSIAFLAGTAWHIRPYSYGWLGYNYGSRCYYWSSNSWRHHHRYHYRGTYCRVNRPYWYGYSRWYDYRPYSYGYTSVVYDSLYDEGYDDGYDRGYNRGYEDGGEDASAYRDDRRRDEIGSKAERHTPNPSIDRAKTNAAEEYRYEMDRGTQAFTKGDYKTATKSYKEALILDPDSADARYSLAISAFAEGKYAFSAFALRRGISLKPDASNIDLQRVFGDPVKYQEYVDSLSEELADNPDDPDLLLLSGYVSLREGDASAAAQKLDRALANAPQDNAAKTLQREAMEALENE